MTKKGVWKIIDKMTFQVIDDELRTNGYKRNGFFRARLVACGYSQVP
jgi:hypothetical protein